MPDMIGNQSGSNSIRREKREEARLSGTPLIIILLGAFLGLTWLSVFILFIAQ